MFNFEKYDKKTEFINLKVIEMIKKIKKILKIIICKCNFIYIFKVIYMLKGDQPKIVMLNTPLHGNLGDQALAYAEEQFCRENFSKKSYVEICADYLDTAYWIIPYFIKKEDIICIHAGGYLGTLWMYEEIRIRKTLLKLKERKIIIFPQTVYFEKNEEGNRELEISKKIFNSCSNLTICARESISYNFMKKNFSKCKNLLLPDMVMVLSKKFFSVQRDGCLLCMRNDAEKTCSVVEKNMIDLAVRAKYKKVWNTDTVVNYKIPKREREQELNRKWKEFASAELIITDRLHGMIFAAITETPCIVILSKSHKIAGCYEWIKNCSYIQLCNNIQELGMKIQEVSDVKKKKWDNSVLLENFKTLKEHMFL